MKKILLITIISILIFSCEPNQYNVHTEKMIENVKIGNKLDSIPQNWTLIEANSKYKKYFHQYPYYGFSYNGYYVVTDESDTILSIYKKQGK
jgi:hypothetical protein